MYRVYRIDKGQPVYLGDVPADTAEQAYAAAIRRYGNGRTLIVESAAAARDTEGDHDGWIQGAQDD